MKFKPRKIIIELDTPEKVQIIEELKQKSGVKETIELFPKAFAIYEAYLDGELIEKKQ